MDTEREAPVTRPARRRPRLSLRMKIALAGLAGVGAAWLIPKGGVTPAPTPSVSPSDRPGVTAVEFPLSSIPAGVTFRQVDGVRVFIVRSGSTVKGFVGLATTVHEGKLFWCPRTSVFETESSSATYDLGGRATSGDVLRDLDHIRVLVAAQRVTFFPHTVTRGSPVPEGTRTFLYPNPCAASERVG